MNSKPVRFGLAAAVVVLIAVVGLQFLGNSNTGDPGATETSQPTATPLLVPTSEPINHIELPASSTLLWDGGPDGVSIRVWSPDIWLGGGLGLLSKDGDPYALVYGSIEEYYAYGDPCHWRTTMPATPATTGEEVVAALQSQTSGRDDDHALMGEWVSEPTDISVFGYGGKSITLHAPTIFPYGCDLYQWAYFASEDYAPHRYLVGDGPSRSVLPGQNDEMWIVDVDGAVVVFDVAYGSDTTQSEVDELRAILASATFE